MKVRCWILFSCRFTCELIELSSADLPMRMPVCVETEEKIV